MDRRGGGRDPDTVIGLSPPAHHARPWYFGRLGAAQPPETQEPAPFFTARASLRSSTPERIRTWLANFDPDFVGLTGDKATVDSIQLSMGLPPSIYEPPDESGFYIVGHASQVVAFSPDGSIRVIYPFGTRQADWKHDIPQLAAAGSDQ